MENTTKEIVDNTTKQTKENPYYSRDCENIEGIDINFEFINNKFTYNKNNWIIRKYESGKKISWLFFLF